MSKVITIPPALKKEVFEVKGTVEIFPQLAGWHFVRVPKSITEFTREFADRGLVAVVVTLGKTTWNSSLLPYGDGTHFIALSKKVRTAEKIEVGDQVNLSFSLRDR